MLKQKGDLTTQRMEKTLHEQGSEHIAFHTRHAWTMLHTGGIKQPWDLSVASTYQDALEPFRKRFKLYGNIGPCNVPQPVDQDMMFDMKCSSFADAGLKLMRKTDELFWEQQLSFERKAAYKKWTSIILENPGAWTISRPRRGESLADLLRNGINESIKDCLGTKATSTLHNRANPLLRYIQFAKDSNADPFPLSEPLVYAFLKAKDVAPTFPRSFMTSVAFSKHILGLMHAEEVLDSGRIRGHSAIHYVRKRKLLQRPPLTVQQIICLEECVRDVARTMYDRIASGFFLLLVFGRWRFSDGQSITEMELERPLGSETGYLECSAERCKTSTSLEKRTRLLPVVVPTASFTVDGWVDTWLECRKKQGLVLGPGKAVLPNPGAGGGWSKVPVSCEVAGDWLRALVKDVPGRKSPVRIATHSCKSAILSMSAKFGMEPAARRFLGYHSAGKDRSMLTYNRDAMSWPVRLMEDMIQQINMGNFDPDASRSGYFPKGSALPDDSKDVESTSSSCDNVTQRTKRKWTTPRMRWQLKPSLESGVQKLSSPALFTSGTAFPGACTSPWMRRACCFGVGAW